MISLTRKFLYRKGVQDQSDDVKNRPREHVRDDAGHSSGAITDKYIDIERQERYASAKDKLLIQDDGTATESS